MINIARCFVSWWDIYQRCFLKPDLRHHSVIDLYGSWTLYPSISQILCLSFSTEVWLGYIMTGVNLLIHIHGPMIFFTWVISFRASQIGKQACLDSWRTVIIYILTFSSILEQASFMFMLLYFRCDIIEVAAEIDRILRPGRWFVLQDTIEVIRNMDPVLRS